MKILSTNHVNNASVWRTIGRKVGITFQPNSKAVRLVENNCAYNIFIKPDSHEFCGTIFNDCKIIALASSNSDGSTGKKIESLRVFDVHCNLISSFSYITLNPISKIFFRTPDNICRQQRLARERSITCNTKGIREWDFQTRSAPVTFLRKEISADSDNSNNQNNKTFIDFGFRCFCFHNDIW